MSFEIIDFHTHPFVDDATNICQYQKDCRLKTETIKDEIGALGISRICGSVIRRNPNIGHWERLKQANEDALRLREALGDFYIPGFHVHPDHVEDSIKEMERMQKEGVRLIGELVPYSSGWDNYACEGFSQILDAAEALGMIVSFHSDEDADAMDEMVRRHPNLVFVAAHPGEKQRFLRHVARAKMSKNYYLDLSGTGLFRYGVLYHAVKEMGADHVLFGTDYPVCTPGMYIGGVVHDPFLNDEEKALVLAGNAKRLLGIGDLL